MMRYLNIHDTCNSEHAFRAHTCSILHKLKLFHEWWSTINCFIYCISIIIGIGYFLIDVKLYKSAQVYVNY